MSTITPPLPSFGGLLHIMPLVVKVCQIASFLPLCQTPHTNWLPLRDQNLLECCPQSIMMDWSVSVWFWKSYNNALVNKVHLGPLILSCELPTQSY